MAATGARAQKPVGSAAWISSEKENSMQLVDQEMEEIEFPVRYEMDWLNEHMAEVFSSNQFNLTEVFKTPGKLRGKTPRTLRKRDPNENRVPLSEIFSSIKKNRVEERFSSSPAAHRSPTKAITAPPPLAPTPPTKGKNTKPANPTYPQYPDLTQSLNSFSQYNTDSGYHGMQDGEDDEEQQQEDDDLVLTQVAPESQLSTQPLDMEPMSVDKGTSRLSLDRRTTDASFHSAHEDVRQRAEAVEPENMDLSGESEEETPHRQLANEIRMSTKLDTQQPPVSPHTKQKLPEPKVEGKLPQEAKSSSPAKAPSTVQPSSPRVEDSFPDRDDMVLDGLDDIGSPSDGSTPDRPPIRKSSLSFASLPAREPLTKKSLGGSRLSRTSHVDLAKPINAGGSSYLGRQTGGHRTTQAALEENSQAPSERMDIDEIKETVEESDADTRASKLHNKSSTQRLHEKISMLGKLQPSRPTKSIPSVALSTTQVAYPDLTMAKTDTKPDTSNQKPRDISVIESVSTHDEDWIKPLNSPLPPNITRGQLTDSNHKSVIGKAAQVPNEPTFAGRSKVNDDEIVRPQTRQGTEGVRGKSSTPVFSSPQRYGHQKSASVNIDNKMTTTPISSPRQDGPLSASKSRLQSIVRSAKGLFMNSGSISAAAKLEASSPDEPRHFERANADTLRNSPRPLSAHSPPRQEGRRTRSSTEREEKRKQQELEERTEKARQQELLRAKQQKAARERSHTESEVRGAPASTVTATSSPSRMPPAKPLSKEAESAIETGSKPVAQPVSQQTRQNDRRPTKPSREPPQKPRPQPVSIRVNSALSRQIPMASSVANTQESNIPAPPPSASKPPTLKKKASNSSLHTAASNSSFKSSVSSQTQRKTQMANDRKREQEEREARRKEEQRRELERKRQQQEEARRDMRSRQEERRERHPEDPKKAAQMQAIEKRRLENARRLERQGSQQPPDVASVHNSEKVASQPSQRSDLGAARPASRLGSVQPFGRPINQPQPNPAKPPKRGMDDEGNHRPATAKPGAMQPSGETKRRRTDDEQNRASMRPTMAPPIRQSNIRKEPTKPSIFGPSQHSAAPQPGPSTFKTSQPQRPGHPMDMAKYASGKIPFAESSNASSQASSHKTPGAGSSHKTVAKPSPNYPNGENINLPEIATDSEDEDSEAEMLPVPKWAQQKELESILRQQEGMEVDSIFGPIAPFSLEETFKSDKKIKKFRDRTSSANWSGADGLTQEEIRRDIAERQRLRLNGGWTYDM